MALELDDLAILTEFECRSLLARHNIGRVGVCLGALPAIFPVNYSLVDIDVYFWTAPGTKLFAALDHAVVAFEVDDTDTDSETGWSVLAVGVAEEIRDRDLAKRAMAGGLRSWLPQRHCLIRVSTDFVSGRRIAASAV